MSVRLRVGAELNDLVKPDAGHDAAPPLPAAPDGIAGTHRVASVQARNWSWLSSAGNNVTDIPTTDFGRAQHQLARRCGGSGDSSDENGDVDR
jgi:hypothetical protein